MEKIKHIPGKSLCLLRLLNETQKCILQRLRICTLSPGNLFFFFFFPQLFLEFQKIFLQSAVNMLFSWLLPLAIICQVGAWAEHPCNCLLSYAQSLVTGIVSSVQDSAA